MGSRINADRRTPSNPFTSPFQTFRRDQTVALGKTLTTFRASGCIIGCSLIAHGRAALCGCWPVLSNLSPNERETLLLFAQGGSDGVYDMNALGKLFTLGLLTIGDERRIALTTAGTKACERIRALKGRGES